MPTPALFHCPTAQTIFEAVPLQRSTDYVDLLYVTGRAVASSSGAEVPYGQDRVRSVGFGSEEVRLRPPMTSDELPNNSLSDPRER